MNPQGVLLNKKVISKIRIPGEDWESTRPAELLVVPLQDNDVILGMPFLASENILIDPAHNKVLLPTDEGNKDLDHSRYRQVLPSICPKMPTLPKLISPESRLIAALKDFDVIAVEPTLNNDTSTKAPTSRTLKEALQTDKDYLRRHEKYIYKFGDVFTEKLPDKLPHPDAPRHRIVLEDEKISING